MPQIVEPVQSSPAQTIDPEDREVAKMLILRLLDHGVSDRNDVALRVWKIAPNFPAGELGALLDEAGLRLGGGAVAPAPTPISAPAPTSAPSPENNPPQRYEYQSTRVSEYQESQESQESHGLLRSLETEIRDDHQEETKKSPAVIPTNPIEAASELAAQIAHEQNHHKTFAHEALWSWPFRLARRLLHFENVLTNGEARRAVEAFAETLYQNWPVWRPRIGECGVEELWVGFLDAFQKARVPEGQDALQRAVQQAQDHPLPLATELPELCGRIAAVAYYLRDLTDGILLLPQARLAKMLNTSQVTVSRCISLLVREKIIAPVSAEWSRNKRQAKTYRWTFCE